MRRSLNDPTTVRGRTIHPSRGALRPGPPATKLRTAQLDELGRRCSARMFMRISRGCRALAPADDSTRSAVSTEA